MSTLLAKVGVLLFYAAAFVSLFAGFPAWLEDVLIYGTLLLLVTHAIEVVVCFRWVRAYEGPLALSILLTLLFGFVHWMPYKRRAMTVDAA